MFRLNRSQIVAVSIETAFQNGSIAFILLQLTLDDPKNDIATIAPIAQIMLTGECFIIAYGHTMLFNIQWPEEYLTNNFYIINCSLATLGIFNCLESIHEIYQERYG